MGQGRVKQSHLMRCGFHPEELEGNEQKGIVERLFKTSTVQQSCPQRSDFSIICTITMQWSLYTCVQKCSLID